MKRIVLALPLLLGSVPVEAKTYDFDVDAVVQVVCTEGVGTAVKVGDDDYISVAHVTKMTECSVGGEPITAVNSIDQDFSSFKGPRSSHILKMSCKGYREDSQYLAVGYAFGNPWLTYEPLIASAFVQEGYRTFVGEVIPGMSGGPVIDRKGRVVGVTNMRWPARSLDLKDTKICKE